MGKFFHKWVAWALVALVWVMTPFVSDRYPEFVSTLYMVLLGVMLVYGLVTAFLRRAWLLGIAAVISVFAYPAMFALVVGLYGFN